MRCADCKFYDPSASDLESNDRCAHAAATFRTSGIREHAETAQYNCFSMLQGLCQNHKLFQPKLEVA